MVNKKGFLKTLEATIAVVLLFFFLFAISPTRIQSESQTPRDIELIQSYIVKEVQINEELRTKILEGEEGDVQDYINDNIIHPSDYQLTAEVYIMNSNPSTTIQLPASIEQSRFTKTIILTDNSEEQGTESKIVTIHLTRD